MSGAYRRWSLRDVGRALLVVGLSVVAVAVAVAGAFIHRWAGIVGLGLAVGAVLGIMVLARYAARTRVGIMGVGLAWLAPMFMLALPRPAGDIVIAGDAPGLTLLFGGAATVAVALGLGVSRHKGEAGG
ncbi:DUF6113 family protein [Phytoactinopolyspora limicola]|uniref:DUF6113 family protein n=1 Tax=Phytoactinopolyspora limicola TaxID=2715536 RepID=UPI001A9C3305|nr:DUF6113 family protein [Phytoactinopolyspora limicola]